MPTIACCSAAAPRARRWRACGSSRAASGPGETPEACLVRELQEELGIDVAASCLAPLTFASHRYPEFHLLMPLYVCRVWEGLPEAREGQALKWLRPRAMADLPMPPADRPLVAFLRDFL
ncbi:MAG: acetyltransferase [Geminicoccaceae bacterium]|nr:acetyltransferase [Geminicoccaceae bacterium]